MSLRTTVAQTCNQHDVLRAASRRCRLQLQGVRSRLGDIVGDEGFLVGCPSSPQCPRGSRGDRMPSPTAYDSKSSVNNWPCRHRQHHKRREKNVFHESRILCVGFPRQNRWHRHESRTLHHEMGRQCAQNVFCRGCRGRVNYQWRGKDVLEDMPMCPVNEWIGQEVRVSFSGVIHCVETGKSSKRRMEKGCRTTRF